VCVFHEKKHEKTKDNVVVVVMKNHMRKRFFWLNDDLSLNTAFLELICV